MNKFYNFINQDELYIYGDIVGGTEKWDESEVTFKDFKDKLDTLKEGSTLNLFVNSGGGSVVATQGIIGLINKAKREKNIKINCTIDGLAGSCASWLPMVADNIYCYNTSLMMVHKPMMGFFMEMLNANELQKNIEVLDKIEETMLNAYEGKFKNTTREEFKSLVDAETWLTAQEMCDLLDITLLEGSKQLVAKVSKDVLSRYKNAPKEVLEAIEEEEETSEDDKESEEKKKLENKIKLLDLELALI